MDETILNRAVKKACQSSCRFKISALGFNSKGELVSSAINTFRFSRKGGGIHAEASIMQNAKRKGIKTILICRVNINGVIQPIEPCKHCAKLANKLGIKIISVSEISIKGNNND